MARAKKAKTGDEPTTMTLSIRLLREDKTVDDAIRDTSEVKEVPAKSGRLFTGQTPGSPPGWLAVVNQFSADGTIELESKSCSSVLFLDASPAGDGKATRTFALAFGGGHLALNPDAFVRNFGLRVTLNSVARGALKNLDVATLDSTTIQKRIQASRKADLQGFGIDYQNDLLRLAGGVPTDTTFASSLAGKDALTITSKLAVSDIATKCNKALQLFNATDYQNDYAFIDQIVPVRDGPLIAELDDLVFDEIQKLMKDQPSDLHITLPEIIDPEKSLNIGYFGIGFKSGTKASYGELAIEDYISELKAGKSADIADMAALKTSHEVRVVVDGQGDKKKRRRIYDCFVFEALHRSKAYVLFASEWYCIEDKFFADVDADYQSMVSSSPVIASTTARNEQELIAELDKDADLLNLDKVKASPFGAAGANLEPCDFLSRRKEFIHLKDGHGSAPISHLWSQGVVSAESFVRDDVFRKAMRTSAIERQKAAGKAGFEALLPNGRSKPIPSDYKVIYGIMRHPYQRSKALGLPFFSKVSLRAAANRIRLMGYAVEVHLIEKK